METFVVVEVWDRVEATAAAPFLSLRSVAAEARIADCTSGRIWSSTLLKIQNKTKVMRESSLLFHVKEGRVRINDGTD